jgi:aspartokinase-like uncharacterized kinase
MSPPDSASPVVIKVGGSLYDLPDLGRRLRDWLEELDTRRILLVPGGGPTVDVIRQLDRLHSLGEEAAHWLAYRGLLVNAYFLKALLPAADVVAGWAECPELWERRQIPILDVHAFAAADDAQPGALPHCWDVTSDAVAARAALVGEARQVILLKSVTVTTTADWTADPGIVDPCFASTLPVGVQAEAVNLRTWQSRRVSGE